MRPLGDIARRHPLAGAAVAAVAAGLLVLAVASGGKDEGTATTTQVVRETKVQVVGGGRGGFDPASIYRRYSPGVVTVISVFGGGAVAGGPLGPGSPDRGLGSGFVLDGDGYVATNAHVVTSGEGDDIARAKEVYVEFGDRNRVTAKVVGYDPDSDVGLLKLSPRGVKLTPLPLGNSERVAVGSPVAAIGSPFGEEQSLSVGVVSATDRTIDSLTSFAIGDAIQTDAAINHGNSGGPLLDARGRVIGINSQIESSSGGGEGVGFAVPVNTVRRSLAQLRAGGRARYPYLGVTSQPVYPQLAERLGLAAANGSLVAKVQQESPADRAGIQAGDRTVRFQAQRIDAGGDLIVAVDGRPVVEENDLAKEISRHDPGETVELTLYRGQDRRTVKVELAARPRAAGRP